jgi:hypothetical protein
MAKLRIQSEKLRYRGTAVVEAAVVFPLLLLLTMGAIEYGWLFLKVQHMTNAARQSARLAIRPDVETQEVLALIDLLMAEGGLADSGYVVNLTPGDIASLSAGDLLEVEIRVPSAGIVIIDASFLPVPQWLRATVTMTKEGP